MKRVIAAGPKYKTNHKIGVTGSYRKKTTMVGAIAVSGFFVFVVVIWALIIAIENRCSENTDVIE